MTDPLPGLLDPCSRHFRYVDLIACGPTWHRLAAAGQPTALPRELATWQAIARLCRDVLDPVVDAFGPIELTYGFAGPALARAVRRGIAPALDQHAGCELRRDGRPICDRLGMAVDFRVPGVASTAVAELIRQHTPFDRLYLYGDDRPLHVSAGPQDSRQIVAVRTGADGRRIPRVLRGPAPADRSAAR